MKLHNISEVLIKELKENEQISYPIYCMKNGRPYYKFFTYKDNDILSLLIVDKNCEVIKEEFIKPKYYSNIISGTDNIEIYNNIYDSIENFESFLYYDRYTDSMHREVFKKLLDIYNNSISKEDANLYNLVGSNFFTQLKW